MTERDQQLKQRWAKIRVRRAELRERELAFRQYFADQKMQKPKQP